MLVIYIVGRFPKEVKILMNNDALLMMLNCIGRTLRAPIKATHFHVWKTVEKLPHRSVRVAHNPQFFYLKVNPLQQIA